MRFLILQEYYLILANNLSHHSMLNTTRTFNSNNKLMTYSNNKRSHNKTQVQEEAIDSTIKTAKIVVIITIIVIIQEATMEVITIVGIIIITIILNTLRIVTIIVNNSHILNSIHNNNSNNCENKINEPSIRMIGD